jgi:hypothetical protein
MWDMKPAAPVEIRGPFQSIASPVPGMRFCEHLPRLAAQAGAVSLLNSVTFPNNDHPFMVYHTLTGRESRVPLGANTVLPPSRSDDPHMRCASGPSSESATTPTIPNSRRVTMASDWTTSAAA